MFFIYVLFNVILIYFKNTQSDIFSLINIIFRVLLVGLDYVRKKKVNDYINKC